MSKTSVMVNNMQNTSQSVEIMDAKFNVSDQQLADMMKNICKYPNLAVFPLDPMGYSCRKMAASSFEVLSSMTASGVVSETGTVELESTTTDTPSSGTAGEDAAAQAGDDFQSAETDTPSSPTSTDDASVQTSNAPMQVEIDFCRDGDPPNSKSTAVALLKATSAQYASAIAAEIEQIVLRKAEKGCELKNSNDAESDLEIRDNRNYSTRFIDPDTSEPQPSEHQLIEPPTV
ncbi:hypothetical protein BJ878DRAFT_559363 [Calycina marina]|uniref:Uncharacterized protein n=1 Tax=Calycina marina TaxID=1763456 RepID=A0A9P7Z7E8_9HELO|nr:hypothetical protein BJ878DRAFT_559363 [Calycina marina]